MIEQNKTTINLVMTGLFAAVVVVLTMISIPMPSGVPITLQTFAVALCGYLLGRKYGVASVLVYMAIGAIGLPVFSGFHGGVGALVGLTGGFIWGFLPMAFLCGLAVKKKNKVLPVISGLAGLVVCHLFGAMQFSLISGKSFMTALLVVSVPYLLKDILSVVAAFVVSLAVGRAMRKTSLAKA